MHVQPEVSKVKVANQPLWAPGAADALKEYLDTRTGKARVLEFGSGGSTIFLLRHGATVVTVEHHELWADALQQAAIDRGLAEKLTILRRDRPYHDVPREFAEGTTFDVILVDGRERIDCLRKALPLLASGGLVLLDDSQRDRYWPAFTLLGGHECVTYRSQARNTTIWKTDGGAPDSAFVRKRFVESAASAEPTRAAVLVPRAYLNGAPLEPNYVWTRSIGDLDPVERKLQQLRLIEKQATYVSPNLYELEGCSLRIDAGHKILRYGSGVFKGKAGTYVPADDVAFDEGTVRLAGRTLDLTASGAGRYSFFLLDSLPKLQVMSAAGYQLDDFDTILVNSGAKWVGEILAPVIGDHLPKLVAFSSQKPSFRMERSVHIEGLRSARFTPEWIYSYLDHILAETPADGGSTPAESFGPFVYLSRQRADGRRIVNHDEFLAALRPFGFTEVFGEDHSPVALAGKLRDAKVLISPHGAGLVNQLFAPRQTTIIELFSSHFTPQYFHLAHDRGQDYHALACFDGEGKNVFDRYDPTTKNKAEFNRENLVVPIAALRALLTSVIPSVSPSDVAPTARPRRWWPFRRR